MSSNTPLALAPRPPTPPPLPTAVKPTAAGVEPSDRLPTFTMDEARPVKLDNRNTLVFAVPVGASVLVELLNPHATNSSRLSHAYEERDLRWLHLLQSVAMVPSRKVETIARAAREARRLLPSPHHRQRLDARLGGLLDAAMPKEGDSSGGSALTLAARGILALKIKDQVAAFLREWAQDPIDGVVLRRDHVVGGMRRDDLVATPVGAGYLRSYRQEDQFCIVLYPWGHGFIHLRHVTRLSEAIDRERRKRRHNEYLPLEHQHLFEQVESLLENHPPPLAECADATDGTESTAVGTAEEKAEAVDLSKYEELLESLREEHINPDVIDHDLSFVRRVQALTTKLKRQKTHAAMEEEAPANGGGGEEDEEMDDDENEGSAAELMVVRRPSSSSSTAAVPPPSTGLSIDGKRLDAAPQDPESGPEEGDDDDDDDQEMTE